MGQPLRFGCFVTGTDTEIGKTLVASATLYALVRQGLQACGMKPVAAGAALRDSVLHNDDADQLVAAGNVSLPASLTTPYMLGEAAAPHIAAARECAVIEAAPILAAYDKVSAVSEAVVVEGVGGFRVALGRGFDTADLAQRLALPVVGVRLGCINHGVLTAEAIAARGLTLAGWVANENDPAMNFTDENVKALAQHLAAPLLGRVPRLPRPTAAAAAAHLDVTRLPQWPQQSERLL